MPALASPVANLGRAGLGHSMIDAGNTKANVASLRLAAMGDVAEIRECAEQAYEIYVTRIGRKPAPMVADFGSQVRQGQVHLVERNETVLGFVVSYRKDCSYFIENVAVRPEAQGQGLGRQLLKFAEDQAKAHGLRAVELYTNVAMTENVELYSRAGYVEFERRQEDGFCRAYFRKVL